MQARVPVLDYSGPGPSSLAPPARNRYIAADVQRRDSRSCRASPSSRDRCGAAVTICPSLRTAGAKECQHPAGHTQFGSCGRVHAVGARAGDPEFGDAPSYPGMAIAGRRPGASHGPSGGQTVAAALGVTGSHQLVRAAWTPHAGWGRHGCRRFTPRGGARFEAAPRGWWPRSR
jgi:hypothetical protein